MATKKDDTKFGFMRFRAECGTIRLATEVPPKRTRGYRRRPLSDSGAPPFSLELGEARDDTARDDCQHAPNELGMLLRRAAERETALCRLALREPSRSCTANANDGCVLRNVELVDPKSVLNAALPSCS